MEKLLQTNLVKTIVGITLFTTFSPTLWTLIFTGPCFRKGLFPLLHFSVHLLTTNFINELQMQIKLKKKWNRWEYLSSWKYTH